MVQANDAGKARSRSRAERLKNAVRRSGSPRYHGAGLKGVPRAGRLTSGNKGGTAVKIALSSLKRRRASGTFCYHSPCGFMVTRGWVLHTPRDSAASMVATPLHGEIAPFRLISPRAKLPPQAVARGSSPDGFSSRSMRSSLRSAQELPGGKTARNVFLTENHAQGCRPAFAEKHPQDVFPGAPAPARQSPAIRLQSGEFPRHPPIAFPAFSQVR